MCQSGNEQGPVPRGKAGSPKNCNRIVKQKTRNTDKALRKVDLGKGRRDEKRKTGGTRTGAESRRKSGGAG